MSLLYLITLVALTYHCMSYNIDCSTTNCQNKFINCLPEQDCFIACTETHSCTGAVINCPMKGNCNVGCTAHKACENTIIDSTLSFGNVNILCDDSNPNHDINSTDHCHNLKVYGSIRKETGTFHISCAGNIRSCLHSEITCPFHAQNCLISCNADASCKDSKIISPHSGHLQINCDGMRSCVNTIFDGAKASQLSIKGCQSEQSCFDMSLYCPPNTDGVANCFMEGNDNLGRFDRPYIPSLTPTNVPTFPTLVPTVVTTNPTQFPTSYPTPQPTHRPTKSPSVYHGDGGVTIYAIHGWKDISIDYSGHFREDTHYGRMHCGSEYNQSCFVSRDRWECNQNICDGMSDIETTVFTTNTPTKSVLILDGIMNKNNLKTRSTLSNVQNHNNGTVSDWNRNVSRYNGINPTVFILVCLGVCVLVCVYVGWARSRQDCNDSQTENDNGGMNNENEELKNEEMRVPMPQRPPLRGGAKFNPAPSRVRNNKHKRHKSPHSMILSDLSPLSRIYIQ